MIYSNGPNPYIATLPDPNNVLPVFESIDPYIPVLGVIPATDGIPIVATTVPIAAVFTPVAVTFVATVEPNAAIASVFADICKP